MPTNGINLSYLFSQVNKPWPEGSIEDAYINEYIRGPKKYPLSTRWWLRLRLFITTVSFKANRIFVYRSYSAPLQGACFHFLKGNILVQKYIGYVEGHFVARQSGLQIRPVFG